MAYESFFLPSYSTNGLFQSMTSCRFGFWIVTNVLKIRSIIELKKLLVQDSIRFNDWTDGHRSNFGRTGVNINM